MDDYSKRLLLATKLASGTATERERDEAIAEILLSLWSEKALDKVIDDKIKACREANGCTGGNFSFAKFILALFGRAVS